MTREELARANKIVKEIKKLEDFIYYAEQVWTGKLIQEKQRFIFMSSPFGGLESKEYFMETDIKNKVLDVLRNELNELEHELSSL